MQGEDVAVCQEAIFWIEHAPAGSQQRSKVIAYLEGNVGVRLIRDRQPVEIRDKKWFGRFSTVREVQVSAGIVAGKPNVLPGIYQRGMEQRKPEVSDALQQNGVNPVQYIAANELPPPGQPPPGAEPLPPGTPPVSPGTRRIRISSRGDVPMQGQWQQDPQTHQAVAIASQGVTMVVEGLTLRKGSIPGVASGPLTIDLSTDRLVVWTVTDRQPDIKDAVVQDEDKPLEVYMEGNVVFREGERIIYAERMYFDVQHRVGTVLAAEMLTPVPGYEGKLRVHAADLQIIAADHFLAQDAWFTASRLGLPPRAGASERCRVRGDPGFRSGNRGADDRPADRSAGPKADGHGAEQRGLHRGRAGLLLADVRHRPERSVVLPPPHPIRATTAFSARKSSPTLPPTSCWASKTARREPTGP